MLALDLSLTSTGYAEFLNGVLFDSGSIQPPSKFTNEQKIHYIAKAIDSKISKRDGIIIEDTFFMRARVTAFKELNRLAGAVIYLVEELTGKDPVFYEAVAARKLVGINTKVSKYDSQVWVIKRHFQTIDLKKYEKEAEDIRKQYVTRKITQSSYDYQLEKLSKKLGKDVGITNDQTDAIILGEAHLTKEKK